MIRRLLHFAVLLPAATFLASGCHNTHADTSKKPAETARQEHGDEGTLIRFVKNPDPAPALEINDLSGKPISLDEDDAAEVKRFAQKAGINYRIGMATDSLQVKYGGVPALPTSFVIDPQGRVVQKHVGLNDPSIY